MPKTFTSLLPFIIAGFMNGSFVIPAKYIQKADHSKIWLYHSLIGLALIPWLILFFVFHQTFRDYTTFDSQLLFALMVSGVIFGFGQLCFIQAIEQIGIALSFAINLSIGVTFGSLFVIFFQSAFPSTKGFWTTVAIGLILGGLGINYQATKLRSTHHTTRAWRLAFLAGIASGLQNITFVLVTFYTPHLQNQACFWVWPPFLLTAAITLFIGSLTKMRPKTVGQGLSLKTLFLITIMGICFTGSLALYSLGMAQLDSIQQMIGWPTFMISIIFSSQLWGFFYKEQATIGSKDSIYRFMSLLLLVSAILILGIS